MTGRYASQIIQLEPAPHEDVWAYHDLEPGYRSELLTLSSLRLYALSPSTQEVTLGLPQNDKTFDTEFRVYGPKNAMVWHTASFPMPLAEFAALKILGDELVRRGKIALA